MVLDLSDCTQDMKARTSIKIIVEKTYSIFDILDSEPHLEADLSLILKSLSDLPHHLIPISNKVSDLKPLFHPTWIICDSKTFEKVEFLVVNAGK